jgi:hypothetical protein
VPAPKGRPVRRTGTDLGGMVVALNLCVPNPIAWLMVTVATVILALDQSPIAPRHRRELPDLQRIMKPCRTRAASRLQVLPYQARKRSERFVCVPPKPSILISTIERAGMIRSPC